MLGGIISFFIMVSNWGWVDAVLLLIGIFFIVKAGDGIYDAWKGKDK